MEKQYGPYHRLGEPGGPGCAVTAIPVMAKQANGTPMPMHLLDGGPNSTEVELLRTIAKGMGINWGHDEFGWWAMVPRQPDASESEGTTEPAK